MLNGLYAEQFKDTEPCKLDEWLVFPSIITGEPGKKGVQTQLHNIIIISSKPLAMRPCDVVILQIFSQYVFQYFIAVS